MYDFETRGVETDYDFMDFMDRLSYQLIFNKYAHVLRPRVRVDVAAVPDLSVC
jgi:hypothetical protein